MTAPEKSKRGSPTAMVIFAILAFLLVVFLGIPGYIAGFYCRVAHDHDSEIAIMDYDYAPAHWHERPCLGLEILLAPAWCASRIAPALKGFYFVQFYDTADPFDQGAKHWIRGAP